MLLGADLIRAVIHRRAVIVVLCLALVGFGFHAFSKLPIEAYPNIAPLNVQIITQWPGRSTLEIERQVTIPIETALAGVPNGHSFRSVSLFGLSVVTIQFDDGVDSFHARQNVQQYLGSANLPAGLQPALSPDSDATGEIMRYRLEGDGIDLTTLRSIQDWSINKSLKAVHGVAEVSGFGGLIKQYQVVPWPERLQAYGIGLPQLVSTLANANANVGGDVMRAGEQQYVVRGVGLLKSMDDIRNVVVAVNQGVPIRAADVAEVRIGNAPRLGMVQFNKEDDVVEGIVVMRRGGNASEVLARVREKIKELNAGSLPPGTKIVPFYDRQNLLDLTTHTVGETFVIGIVLVVAVLYFFLANLRAAAIVSAVIPLALFVAFIGMLLFGIPANLISLGAIDFGLIVNAAVIIVENILRPLEEGRVEINEAIVDATSEVQRAMIFSTAIIVVAYSPLFVMGGVEGKIFEPMAFTMGLALVASIVLALTLVPAVASWLFKGGVRPHTPQFVERALAAYRILLRRLIAKPKKVFIVSAIALVIALISAFHLGTNFLPTLEENNLWIRITLPNTVDLGYSADVATKIRNYLIQQPEVQNVAVQIGRPDDGTDSTGVFNQEYGVYFKRPDQWPPGRSRADVVIRLQKYFDQIPGIAYNFSQYIQDNVAEALSGVKGENTVKIFGPDLDTLQSKATQIEKVLRGVRGAADVGTFRELGQPTLNVTVNRVNCARFGLNVTDIENLVLNAIGGNPVTSILEGEMTFNLAVRFPELSRNTLDKLRRLLVDAPDGQRIPLSMVAQVELTDGPFFIYRELGQRYIAIKFGVRDRDLGGTVADAQAAVAQSVQLPWGYRLQWDGEFNQMKEAQAKLAIIIPLTLLVIFLLLYSTFGNVKDAAIVLLNVPFAAIGGIAALYLSQEEMSISAGIGFLSLFGIAIQNGVILIEYVKKLSEEHGHDLIDAVVQGSAMRLRPVAMTALLAGLGLLPAALSHAVGSQAQRPLALVIVGGMVTTTLLTLLVLPVIFAWLKGRSKSTNQMM